MKIVISEIPEQGLDISHEEAIQSDAVRTISPARLNLRVEKIGAEVIVKGSIRASVGLVCSRCLRNFQRQIEAPVNVMYQPADEPRGGQRYELSAGELETGFYRGDELDMEELFKEQLLLSTPIKPLCTESCKGICPKCGADLNEGACRCTAEEADIRLDALKKYFERRRE